MRREDRTTDQLFSYVNVEDRIASDHPLRQVRLLVNDALKALDAELSELYAQATGRSSIAPERLLRAMLLQAIYSIRSERQLMGKRCERPTDITCSLSALFARALRFGLEQSFGTNGATFVGFGREPCKPA